MSGWCTLFCVTGLLARLPGECYAEDKAGRSKGGTEWNGMDGWMGCMDIIKTKFFSLFAM